MSYRHDLKFLKNETELNTTVRAIIQRLCLWGVVPTYATMELLAPLDGNDHSIVVDRGDRFGCFWPLFPLMVLHKLRRTGRQAR